MKNNVPLQPTTPDHSQLDAFDELEVMTDGELDQISGGFVSVQHKNIKIDVSPPAAPPGVPIPYPN